MVDVRSVTHRCPICGKSFVVFDGEWGYTQVNKKTYRTKYFCSYGCMRKYEIPNLIRINEKALRMHKAYGR